METATKTERRKGMLRHINERHDFQPEGEVWQWEACGVRGTEQCAICGLTHKWGRNGQNSADYDRFFRPDGEEITLAEATRERCE